MLVITICFVCLLIIVWVCSSRQLHRKLKNYRLLKPGETVYLYSEPLSTEFKKPIYLPAKFENFIHLHVGEDVIDSAKITYVGENGNNVSIFCDEQYVKRNLLLIKNKEDHEVQC